MVIPDDLIEIFSTIRAELNDTDLIFMKLIVNNNNNNQEIKRWVFKRIAKVLFLLCFSDDIML